MSLLRRFLFCVPLLVLLFGVFSNSCYAKEVYRDELITQTEIYIGSQSGTTGYVSNGNHANKEFTFTSSPASSSASFYSVIKRNDETTLLHKGNSIDIEIARLFIYFYSGSRASYPYNKSSNMTVNASSVEVGGYDVYGGYHALDADIEIRAYSNGMYTIRASSDDVPADLLSLRVKYTYSHLSDLLPVYSGYSEYILQVGYSASFVSVVEESSEEAGLLKRILNKITSIGTVISDIFNKIVELPNVIFEKLKDFFLPDEEFIANYKNNFDTLFSEHLGALYQSIDAFDNLYDSFTEQVDSQDSIEMPVVNVTLAGSDFSFGGYTVDLIPDRFDPIVNILKTLLGIVATLLFVNMLKKRYEGVVSK